MAKVTISEGQINQWKSQYGGDAVKMVIVPLGDPTFKLNDKGEQTDELTTPESAVGYFRKPDLKVIQAAAPHLDSDPVKAGLIQLENCWLGGDDDFQTNDEVKMSAIQALNRLFKVRVATIKNA